MAKIIAAPDCGNSPKAQLLKDWNIAFVKGDTEYLLDQVTEDIHWRIVGDKVVEGKADFRAALEEMSAIKAVSLEIEHIITHGKAGSVNGVIKLENGKAYSFCDVYSFKNAKGDSIKSFSSYVIEI